MKQMKQMKQTTTKSSKDDRRLTIKGGDIRDVRGASIRPSHKIPSKMDKMKDAKRQRRSRIEFDEEYDGEDIEWNELDDGENNSSKSTERLFDNIYDMLEEDDSVKNFYVNDETNMTVCFTNGEVCDITITPR